MSKLNMAQIEKLYGHKRGAAKKPSKTAPAPTFFSDHKTIKKPHNFKRKASDQLMGFQDTGVEHIEEFNGRALLCDDAGLGKTAQALSWLQRRPDLRPAVIVCPAFLKINWSEEVQMWIDDPHVKIINGVYKAGLNIDCDDIIIINYDILANEHDLYYDEKGRKKYEEYHYTGWIDFLLDIKPVVSIVDELHYAKNEKSFRSKATIKLIKATKHSVAISATPFENKPIELFPALNALRPDIFPNKYIYGKRYCGGKMGTFGWEFKGATNTRELHNLLAEHLMIRRRKKDVLKDLPDKMRNVVKIGLSNKKEYRKAEKDFIAWLKAKKDGKKRAKTAIKAEALTRISTLEKLAYRGKLADSIEWIENFLESGEKLVVFGKHTSIVGTLMNHFGDIAVRIDGSMSTKKKQKSKEAFQTDDKIRLLVGNIDAAGVGWTFTAASNVCFVQFPWSPSKLTQAEDRIHRIGQESDSVSVWYLVAQDTIEIDRLEMLNDKQKIFDAIMDGDEDGEGIGEGVMDEVFFQEAQSMRDTFAEQYLTAA